MSTQPDPNHTLTLPTRVVVKLSESALKDRYGDAREQAMVELGAAVSAGKFRPYFEGEDAKFAERPPFNRYVVLDVSDRESGRELVSRVLRQKTLVEEAYVDGGPVPPPVAAANDPRSVNQGYLNAAPEGIDAHWVWQEKTTGAGIGFVDLEQGWALHHEDLEGAQITLISGVNRAYFGHGTAVLGQVVAVDNQLGVIGIAHGATCRVVSQYRAPYEYNTAAAILGAGEVMRAGDVLLLEAQTSYDGHADLPVEVEGAVFDAICDVTGKGIVVIEAAGNGGHDLDTFENNTNQQVLNRNSADYRESGAIMVAAASSSAPHLRLAFTCYGSRIDCYGWGENVDTTGDGHWGTAPGAYTPVFNGTSSASPIVAGAAVLLQSWRKQLGLPVYSPAEVRALLSRCDYNTPSASPGSDRIGVMPNLRAIIEGELAT